jgi:amino acid adenylation domain-containing protein
MHKATESYRQILNLSAEAKRALLARLLRDRGATCSDSSECLHRLFEIQAAYRPDAVALTFEDQMISYGDLNVAANRLAHRLRALGVGPGVLVGIYLERSADVVIGILGILKAGGAYVPLDTIYPTDRAAFILQDAGAPVLLTRRSLVAKLPRQSADLLCLDDEADNFGDENPDAGTLPDDLAYVIYTSGSTGTPKGVAVSHANVTRLFSATDAWFQFGPEDVWTLFHSFAFDFSVWEIWGALLHGGRLVVVPYWLGRSPEAFLELLRSERVTVLNQTPSAFRQLIRADDEAEDRDDLALRVVIFGGEALELQSLRPWFDRHKDDRPKIVNMYGITETTVHVTYRPVSAADLDGPPGASPIGRPVSDLRVYLLDRHFQPVPIGVVGEIYVGGPGLARGYLNAPALTAQRFVPDPFGPPGCRMYRSGDLARRRVDGDIDYVGRADHQVKIRGFRIELGEIEAALVKHPEVREAIVLAREDRPGDQRLAAYLVPRKGTAPTKAEMRTWLTPILPDYMVPSAFVPLRVLPLTPHGKVDRAALPAPNSARPVEDDILESPRTPVEEIVAAAWADILEIDHISIADDFFALGGHSLLATRLASRLRTSFGIDVPLRALFEAPTVTAQAARIEALLQGAPRRAAPPIVAAPRTGEIPVSFAQQALWFLDRLDPGRPTFNVSAAVRVHGALSVDALGRAFDEIVRRHEALRTTFRLVDGRPVQVVTPSSTSQLKVHDLRNLPDSSRTTVARQMAIDESRQPFDLANGPLVRASLFQLDEWDNAVLLTMHHIVTDGWSFGIAAQELASLYEAFRAGEPSPLPELSVQYADFARWQRDWLQGETLDRLLAEWSRRLSGVAPLELPTDRPRPAVRAARGAIRLFDLPADLVGALRTFSRREGATPFMTLLAAFEVLLYRYSGQADFAVGSPIANRNRAETEGLIGYFVNMLALRANLAGDPSFLDLLARVRETSLHAFERQDLPFEILVEALRPGRDLSRTPVFQVMFVLQTNRLPNIERHDLAVSPFDTQAGTETAKFDLTLALEDDDQGGMVGSMEYDAALFNEATIDRMIDHFRVLLHAVVEAPDTQVSRLPILTELERCELLDNRNPTDTDLPEPALAHRLFEKQAARTPDAVALMDDGRSLTYRDLNERANQLARVLRHRGVGPDSRVGLLIGRSAEAAIGLLGILKAGGSFVPLDPDYPADRLTFMLEDSRVSILVTHRDLDGSFPAYGAQVVTLHLDDPAIDLEPGQALAVPLSSADAAYVIYTSGSSGKPRGVVVSHRSLVNHNLAAKSLFGLEPSDRVLQFSTLSFDIAVEEIFPTWASGATVVLRGREDTLDPSRFTRWIEERGITVLDLPTAYWHAWVDGLAASGGELPASLRLVVVGGERALPRSFVNWRAIGGDRARWINTYGPTETTVIATAYEPRTRESRDSSNRELPIGRPIANTRIYLLDSHMQLVPDGLPGELYIGGAGVARGYLNQPVLTAEKFVPDPFSGDFGARLFRTGDRARWRQDGELEFLGRIDQQIKIRGFRVEPGEIEAALLTLPEIRSSAVVARTDPTGNTRLDAYIVAEPVSHATVAATSLRSRLREALPRHMIPSTFTTLADFPMTPSGKVDREALPPPAARTFAQGELARDPADELENRLVAIWEEVLELRPVGVDENFFDLGGHSLLAIRLLSRIEEEFGRALPLSSLFLGATIEDLAAVLREHAVPTSSNPLVSIQAKGSQPPFFCIHPAGGIVYCFRELARQLGEDRPFYGVQSPGLEEGGTLPEDLNGMASAYINALRRVQPQGPYHLGGWSLGGIVAFEMACQLQQQGHDVATLALLDARAPDPKRYVIPDRLRELARDVAALDLFGEVNDKYDFDPNDDLLVFAEFAGELTTDFGGNASDLLKHLRSLPTDQRREHLLRALKLDEVYHMEAGPDRVRRLWTVLRANLLATARYAPRTYSGELHLFRARDRGAEFRLDPTMGWKAFVDKRVHVHVIAGDHAGILRSPGVYSVAEILRNAMNRSGAAS